uniref:uncharacterized protein LOC120342769 n=1 Tax=Styela clava TaxID=7725 RepID=UPI00193A0F95|nr:uncharacterized protein LOC120342769 [Styela clava]
MRRSQGSTGDSIISLKTAGSCISKIVNGKLVQVGDCKKDDGSEIARLIQKSLEEKKKAEIKCDVTYNSKCFRAVMYGTSNVTFNDAQSICKSTNNGKPANMYDPTNYQLLVSYLHTLLPAGWGFINIWTGMKYSHQSNLLSLSSGVSFPIEKEVWIFGYPSSDALQTNIVVRVMNDLGNSGLLNGAPSWTIHGVICEI